MEETHSHNPPANPYGGGGYRPFPTPLPNANAVLVLGILSIALCICYGVVGLILGIIALVLSSRCKAMYEAQPSAYTPSSYNNMNAGRICAIIGICLSAVYFLFVLYLIIVGAAMSTVPWYMMEQ